jgi:enoyl-CoA hydratase
MVSTAQQRQSGPSGAGLVVERSDAAVVIRIDRPPVNAFTIRMFAVMTELFEELSGDSRPVAIIGSSDIFSAGFDIKQEFGVAAGNAAASRCLAAIQNHAAPVVTAVEGAAVGLGLLIATSSDILVISRTARIRMPEVTLGIISDVGPLRRFVPDPWIRRMCMLGEAYSAEELRLDVAGAVLAQPGTVVAIAEAQLAALASLSPRTLALTKRKLYEP